jgi:hypothetical protein
LKNKTEAFCFNPLFHFFQHSIIYGGGATALDMVEGINAEGAVETKRIN